MEPLRKALRLPRVNLFIADDTGLGKTIEAGLIARELLLRKKAKTIVVAAPASVLEQWKVEMEERFGLIFVILDRAYLTRVRQERGFGVNPWRTHSRFLVSHNLLIDPTYADPMREWLGEMQPGSLLILDEAHHAAPSSGGRYGIETKFTRAIRDLGGRFEHRLFLSATPHNSHSNSFSTLLEPLDPYRFTRGVPVRGKNALEDVMVRRIKEDVREIQGGFPERVVRRISIEDLPEDAPELLLSRLLDEYRGLREERLKNAPARARAAAGLLVVGLQQKLLSSIEAFAISLARHRTTVRKQWERAMSGEAAASGHDNALASARSFASPPDADDERAGVSDDDREVEEATQIAAIDAGVLTDDTVHLHLEQRVAQRLLARFRAQGFVYHDLSRACLVQSADSIPRVVLLGRLCLFGRRAERLHEVLVPVAARWLEPSRRAGPLKAYAEEAEARTLERLESALQTARAPGARIHDRLLEAAARDVEDLLPQLEERAELVAQSAMERLRERDEREERQLRETLEGQRERVEAELRRHEGGGIQLVIEFSEEERRQRQADVASWRTRLAQFDRDLETEPDRMRTFYEVRARRVEPIGLVYLWPDTG